MPITHPCTTHPVLARGHNAALRLTLAAAAALALPGCANLHTIDRVTDLPANGKAIHLDSPQRVMYVRSDGKSCAEPTPDALQSYISSFGGTINTGPESASASSVLNANAASVGLHSQSITLMRQHLFNICEFAQNQWLNDADVLLLTERSQDLTLGVLAIEQLTGAVVARPASLVGNTDTVELQKARLKASAAALTTQAKLDLATKREQAAQADFNAAIQSMQAAGTATVKQANKQPVMLKTAQEDTSSAAAPAAGNEAQVNDASEALAQATADRAAVQEQLAEHLAQSDGGENSAATTGAPPQGSNINEGTVSHLAKASVDIVRMILEKGRLTDMCISIMTHPKKHDQAGQHYKDVMDQCKTVLAADMRPDTRRPYSYSQLLPTDPQ